MYTDVYISSVTDVVISFIDSNSGKVIFGLLFLSSLIASIIISKKVFAIIDRKTSLHRIKMPFRIIQVIIYSLASILFYSVFLDNKYYTINVISIMIICYGTSIASSIFIGYKLFTWFKENKNKFALLFGLAIIALFINNVVSLLLFTILLTEKPLEIDSSTTIVFNFDCEIKSIYCYFKSNIITIQSYVLVIYFLLFWVCNCFLLHYQITKIGKIRFFTLVASPLILFFFMFIYHYDELYNLSLSQNFENIIFMLQIFIITLSGTLCGILYGLGFRSVANLLKVSAKVENYLKMAAFGIILVFICANATLAGAAFPPFGVSAILFLPFASILFYVGVYYSIIAISNDIKVRKYIKNSAYKELEIMGSLAQSQIMDNMKEKVIKMTKKYSEELHQNNNTETMELEEDLQSYLDEAIRIFKQKEKNSLNS